MKLAILTLIGFCGVMGYGRMAPTASLPAIRTDTLAVDPETGLYQDQNLYMIKAHCTNCHSTKLIQQHRFTRDGWKQKIRWMQANHNLWQLGDAEPIILDYLEKYYTPVNAKSRRAPLRDIKWYKLAN